MSNKLKLTFFGGVGTVTGANFLLENAMTKILIDCGLVQGYFRDKDPNREDFKYNPAEIDYLLVTHAHLDHIGRIGKLVKDGFKGKIFSTAPTLDIAKYMFEDALKISSVESKRNNKEPLYDEKDIEKTLSLWQTLDYHQVFDIGSFAIFAKDAGHILGSAIFEITDKSSGKKIAFTGDLGNSPTPLLRDTEKVTDADYLVIESVYGDRNHEEKEMRTEKLKVALNRVIDRGGVMVIPVFSIEKTQVLLHELDNLIEGGQVKSVPVFLDSPLGIKITSVYAKYLSHYNDNVQKEIKSGDDIFDFPKLSMTLKADQSRDIYNTKPPFVLIAGSGMSEGGRITEHEKNYYQTEEMLCWLLVTKLRALLVEKSKKVRKKFLLIMKK